MTAQADGAVAKGEWSDASEDVVKSGSATDASKGDMDDTSFKKPAKQDRESSFLQPSLSSKKDPLNSILDKIDAELAALPARESAGIMKTSPNSKHSRSPSPFRNLSRKGGQDSEAVELQNGVSESFREEEAWGSDQQDQKIAGSAEIYTDATLTDAPTDDDGAAGWVPDHDNPSDLDSVVAQQIDNRFKEILMKKKVSLDPSTFLQKPSSPPHDQRDTTSLYRVAGGYGTDNESIRTEDFESRFHSLLVMSDGSMAAETFTRKRQVQSNSNRGGTSRGQGNEKKLGKMIRLTPVPKPLTSQKASPRLAGESTDTKSSGLGLPSTIRSVLTHSMKSLGESVSPAPTASDLAGEVTDPSHVRSSNFTSDRLPSLPDQTSAASFRDTDNLAAASQEIERQSARIQREMALERRARSVSPTRGMMTSPAALPPRPTRAPTPARLQTTPAAQDSSGDSFSTTNLGLDVNTADKMMSQDLKVLRGALLTAKLQLREAEKEARETRTKAEEARSELMLLEFKKNTARKDLELLLDDVRRKQNLSENYRTEMNVKLNELREFQALGLTKEDAKNLQDENVNLKLRQRVMDELELERDELGRQLDSAKDDLLREQKQARLQREEMIEEIETLNSRLEETQNGWATAQQQFQKLEAAFRQMEREKNDLIQEKTKEYNALKTLTRQENKESRQFLSQELDTLTSEVQDLRTRVNSLQAEVSAKTDQNAQLREQVMSLTSQVSREKAARAAATEEQRKTLQMLRKETDHAMLQLRESMFLEKQSALEDLKAELDQERRHSLSRSDERMAQLLAENAELISEKNQEIVRLQEMLQELRQSADRRFQEKVDQQIREAVARERATIEVENQWKLRTERESLARDTKQHINEMQMALDKEREASHRLSRELSQLKEELEEQKRVSRETLKEKMAAVVRAKEQVREQSNQEIDKVKEKVKQEMQREIDRLQSKLQDSEEEVRTLRTEKQQLLGRERESLTAMDRTEKTVINEINEECRRTASLLGVLPRQVQFSTADDTGTSRTQITNALANLRANNEELRNRVEELTTELDSYRNIVASAEKEKQESLESLRMEMDKKKNTELEKLKEKLIREHLEELARVAQTSARQSLANSMVGALRRKDTEIEELKAALDVWRQQAADNYTQPYKTELARELEKSQTMLLSSSREQKRINDLQQQEITRLEREVQRLAMMQNNKLASHHDRPPSPSPAAQQQQLLQARIKQLQSENNELRRKHLSKHNTSVPDLSTLLFQNSPHRPASPSREQREKFRALEDRIRVGEKESLLAEERAKLSQTALSKKMDEMTKLQNTLNSQNHELLQLEQAYTQLHRQYNQSPAVTTSLILHNTR